MFRSRIDLGGKTRVLKVGLLARPALFRCHRSLNSLVKCTTSRLTLNCLWTRQTSTCLNINEVRSPDKGPLPTHTCLHPWGRRRRFLEADQQKVLPGLPRKTNYVRRLSGSSWANLRLAGTAGKLYICTYIHVHIYTLMLNSDFGENVCKIFLEYH